MSSSTVKDGIIQRLSVSQVEKFDPTTTWGCPRRWWFRYVAGMPEPQPAAAAKGEAIHKQLENALLHDGPLGSEAEAVRHIVDAIKPRVQGVEVPIEGRTLLCEGIPFAGRIDALLSGPLEVLDWKTTSDVVAYSKDVEQVVNSLQMTGYAKWVLDQNPTERWVTVTHVYIGTRRSEYAYRSGKTCREDVENRWTAVGARVREMVGAARESDPAKLPYNPAACVVGRSVCPFRGVCPLPVDDVFAIFDAPVLPPDSPPPVTTPTHSSVGQPSPASPEAVSPPKPTPPAPSKRGRPRKTTIVDVSTTPDAPMGEVTRAVDALNGVEAFRVTRVVVTHGMTLNLGDYNSGRADVTMEATVEKGADHATVREALSRMVRKALEAEMEPHMRARKSKP